MGQAMHVVVVTVSIEPGQAEASAAVLREQVVPRVAESPGFSGGYWTAGADETVGLSFVLFDTEENAQANADMARNFPTPPGVTITSVEVREVVAQA
jgi:hypothetical protein